jgi:PAS domain S-box-containing protein
MIMKRPKGAMVGPSPNVDSSSESGGRAQSEHGSVLDHPFLVDLLEAIPIGMMILDSEGRIIRISKHQEKISGIPENLVRGRFFHEAFPRTLEQGLRRPYWRLLRDNISFDVTIDRYIPQYYSRLMTYRGRGAYLKRSNSYVLLHDLEEELFQTKRKVERRTKELEKSKTFLESLINSSPNVIVGTDLGNRVIIFNDAAERAFLYSRQEIFRRSVRRLFLRSTHYAKGEGSVDTDKEVTCVRKDGTSFPASLVTSYVVDSEGRRRGRLYIISDLTERKAMEERLSISERLAIYSELMGGIAHQINNPMIGVVNFAQMLLREFDTDDPRAELVQGILRAAGECLQIIKSVLGCLKDSTVTCTKLSLNDLLISVVDYLREESPSGFIGMRVCLNLGNDIPEIMGDELQLRQCFLNILRNAVEVMNGRKGILTITTAYEDAGRMVRVTITDTGPGIPKENLDRIFLPFFSWPRRPSHYGLGLSFAYRTIRNHGGRIEVTSEVGSGTSFSVWLPVELADGT